MGNCVVMNKKDGISVVKLNRPDVLNAISRELLGDLIDALNDAERDKSIGVVILTGEGRAFSAGGDLDEILTLSASGIEVRRNYLRLFKAAIETIREISKPVIAAVNGYCIGGGNEINVACDLTIASEKAKFGQAGTKVGSVPMMGVTQLLPLLVGEKKSREIVYLCRVYDAYEAERMGWVNKVVPHEKLMEEAESWAMEILDKSPTAIAIAKKAHNAFYNLLRQSLEDGIELLSLFWGTDEAKEGFTAFKERRKPKFRG